MTNVALAQPPVTQQQIESFADHLRQLQETFNARAVEIGLPIRMDVQMQIDGVTQGWGVAAALDFINRADDTGVLHDEQLKTAVDCINSMLDEQGRDGVVLGAMQSGKTTTSMALQFAGPIIYLMTGRRLYPIYLTTSQTGQEDQTRLDLYSFLHFYGHVKFALVDRSPPAELLPAFVTAPTVALYRSHVLRNALVDVQMGPQLEDFVQRRVHGQRIGQIADLCRRAHQENFEPMLMIDEPQYGASDRMVADSQGALQRRPCVLLQLFEAIETAIGQDQGYCFVGFSATPYELHELENLWVVRQYLSPAYRGFNFFGGRIIADGVPIEPPTTLGLTEFGQRRGIADFEKVSMAAYGATPTRFARMARQLGFAGSQNEYQDMVIRAVRTAIIGMVRESSSPTGVCIRPVNSNARAAEFVRQLDLESAGIEVVHYYGSEFAGQSIKRVLRGRRHPDRPYVIVVTNRARMGDAFPTAVKWFIDFGERAGNLNSLLQGLLGRACGYNKTSTVVMSDDNKQIVDAYVRALGGYIYSTSSHSIVVGGYRRGAPSNVLRVSAEMDDDVVRAFFARLQSEVTSQTVMDGTPTLQPRRARGEGAFRAGPILTIAEEVGLFEHLENPEVAARLFPLIREPFQIVRRDGEVVHSRTPGRILRYQFSANGSDCRYTYRWSGDDQDHAGVASRGYGARDATDRARAADGLEPQIHMEKYDPATGDTIFDKGSAHKVPGSWRPRMIILPLVHAVREIEEGTASYPKEMSVYASWMTEDERESAGFSRQGGADA